MNPELFTSDPPTLVSVKGVALTVGEPPEMRRQKLARIIVDAMYQFLGLLDVDGTVLEINQAALDGAGVLLEDVVGKPFWEARWWAISDEARRRVRDMVAIARRGEFVRCDIEVFGDQQGSKSIYVDFSLTPIHDDEGHIAFLLPEGRNITEKIAIEAELTRKNGELQLALERLREIDGFKTKFFANVSHDLRTPLALILGPIDQLLKEAQARPAVERDRFRLATIKRNAESLQQQVNDLLDLARIDAQQMPMAYVCANVTALLRDVAASFAAAAEERSIALLLNGADELYADVDRAKIVRIMVNLLSNAFKFTPKGGRISCSLQRVANRRFLFSLQDNGPGIPPQLKEQIFSRFAQGQDGLSVGGSGLGLNIVKEFVELHLGTVVVLDAPGGGAIFQVEMPMRAPKGVFVRESSETVAWSNHSSLDLSATLSPPARAHKAGLPRILVAEDNPDLRHFLYDVLIDDYNVTLVTDGAEALASALESPPDLVITDLMMPHFDGVQFVRELRVSGRCLNLPVLVLSARADDALRATLLENLVQDYLMKPFSPQELRARVRNLVTVKRTVDLLQNELNSQASDVSELTANLVASRKSLQQGLLALQISERRWQGLYQNTSVGIALADREGRILKANPALQRMLGYAEDEIVGISFIDLAEESQRAMTKRNVHGVFDGVIGNYQVQKRYEKANGDWLWVNVSASLIPAIDEEGPRLAVIVEDISSRKEAENSLAATQAELARVTRFTAMGELAASIAHEVNQPLSAIVTNSQAALRWMERDLPDYQEVAAALHRVNRDATLAGDVIARIREFLGRGEVKQERVNVGRIVENLLLMLQSLLQESSIEVNVKIDPALPDPIADPVQLQQVLLNLAVNAVDAMQNQDTASRVLAITVQRDPAEGVVFSVSDTGPGVSPEYGENIFEALFSTKSNGLGMGLAICRSIVEKHGGRLRLKRAVGGGANFVFNIPESP